MGIKTDKLKKTERAIPQFANFLESNFGFPIRKKFYEFLYFPNCKILKISRFFNFCNSSKISQILQF